MVQTSNSKRTIIYLLSLITLKSVMQLELYRRGFISVSADEFSRGIRAAKWAADPQFDIWTDLQRVWFPLEKYLNGTLLAIWRDEILAPRLTAFLASCILLVGLFLLVKTIFESEKAAILASLFVIFVPWTIWLGGTPMLEMYYLAFFILGLYFLVGWLKDGRRHYWMWAGLCFFVASAFHIQVWIVINVVNLFTIGFLISTIRGRQYGQLSRLIAYYFLSSAFIVLFGLSNFSGSTQSSPFLTFHSSYSAWFYADIDQSVLDGLLFLPKAIIRSTNLVFWILLAIGLLFLVRDDDRKWKLTPLGIAILTLIISGVVIVMSGPPSAAPDRNALIYLILLAPIVGYAGARMLSMEGLPGNRIVRGMPAIMFIVLFLISSGWGVRTAFDYPRVVSWDAIHAGRQLKQLLDQSSCGHRDNLMLELRYWDYLAVELAARHYDSIVYDREYDLRNRDTTSVFENDEDIIYDALINGDMCFVALRTSELNSKAQQTHFLHPIQNHGEWTIYEFRP